MKNDKSKSHEHDCWQYEEELEYYRGMLMDDEDVDFMLGRHQITPPPEPDKKEDK